LNKKKDPREKKSQKHIPTTDNLLTYKESKAETRRLMKKTRRETWKEFVGTIAEKTSSKTVWNNTPHPILDHRQRHKNGRSMEDDERPGY
jgi:hypothetical protein